MTTIEPPTTTFRVTLPVNIRQATADDLPKLELNGQFQSFRVLFRRAFREQRAGRRIMLVADCNGTPAGRLFVLLHSTDPSIANGTSHAYLYSFFVMDLMRGMGIGTQLLRTAEQMLVDKGFTNATIAAAKENTSALRLYQRFGYVIVRDDPGRWSYTDHEGRVHRMNEPCWILEKSLNVR